MCIDGYFLNFSFKTGLYKLGQNGLTVKPSKCEIRHATLDLLGHVVGGGSIQPQDRKREKILEMRKPETMKELKSFLETIDSIRSTLIDMPKRERH